MMTKSYSELVKFDSWEDRFSYLKLGGEVGRSTFGFDRYINQKFYTSREWKDVRRLVLVRDNGCDLGVLGYEIPLRPLIHHMNPMSIDDILHGETWIIDPEFLITVTHTTHNDIHYGVDTSLPKVVNERSPRDTNLW